MIDADRAAFMEWFIMEFRGRVNPEDRSQDAEQESAKLAADAIARAVRADRKRITETGVCEPEPIPWRAAMQENEG
jgi:hypothetical protein